jgi:hypothetical protein
MKKKCTKCKLEKPIEDFHKKKNHKDGRRTRCIECEKEDRVLAIKNDPKSEYRREWRRNIANREKYILRGAKGRAKVRNLEFNLEINDILIPEYCPILGVKLTVGVISHKDKFGPSLDRIDNTKGYIKGNIMIISKRANAMKNDASLEELKAFAKYFYEK